MINLGGYFFIGALLLLNFNLLEAKNINELKYKTNSSKEILSSRGKKQDISKKNSDYRPSINFGPGPSDTVTAPKKAPTRKSIISYANRSPFKN
ncbi:MAG: hypothetical protein H0V82_10210 [Candidatus Protochlamydia sp.]|nr:hypothetical protein [Candidatus Protochlamydia sp.]